MEHKKIEPEDLGGVVGGGPTENRYNQNDCKNISGPCDRCYGHWLGNLGMWCDHYRRETISADQRREEIRHTCKMGRYVTIETKHYDPYDA